MKKHKHEQSDISLSIDDWEDLFDDFDSDPEDYSKRTISDDFLDALELRYNNNNRKYFQEITIHAPTSLRDKNDEKSILYRLDEQIQACFKAKHKLVIPQLTDGLILTGAGIIFFLIKDIVFSENAKYFVDILCWLGIWEGCTKTYEAISESLPSWRFYKLLAKADIRIVYK